MRKDVREVITYAEALGFVNEGQDGRGHYVLRHKASGACERVPATPGAYTWRANCLATLRRIAGVHSDRPRAAHYRHERHAPTLDTHLSVKEQQAIEEADALRHEHRLITDRLLALTVDPSRNAVAEARPLAARLVVVEKRLRALHKPIPQVHR